ncbi:hypothetical protein ACHQM5_018254 [Ranunculus cassubicifolius]
MSSLKTLILRNCNLTGEIPSYLGNMPNLKSLDLSFNKLTGSLPSSFSGSSASNLLDISYNNVTLRVWIQPVIAILPLCVCYVCALVTRLEV